MSETALRLQNELMQLPEEDRRQLAHLLWESLDGPLEDEVDMDESAWIAELDRRSADAAANPNDARPFREVIAELRGELP